MPEGDTVFRTAHRLDAALAGRTVTTFDVRVPRAATVDLTRATVHEVVARGKHLLLRIGTNTLHSHLRMEGAWLLYPPGQRYRHADHRVRAVVGTAASVAVGVDLAMVEVTPTKNEAALIGHLGPDPLASDWDAPQAVARVQSDPRAIHVALLDQRNVAGFGNEYGSELLFLRGIMPTTPTSDADVAALITLGARTLQANRYRVRRTFTGDTRRGRTHWVYGRAGRPCLRCGTLIERGNIGARADQQRIVFWCPHCQKAPL